MSACAGCGRQITNSRDQRSTYVSQRPLTPHLSQQRKSGICFVPWKRNIASSAKLLSFLSNLRCYFVHFFLRIRDAVMGLANITINIAIYAAKLP